MSGIFHSIVRARASVEYLKLLREPQVVSGVAIPAAPETSPFLRGYGATVEPTACLLTNPTPEDADFELKLVTPYGQGEYLVTASTIASLGTGFITATSLEPGESLRVDLLPSSAPGAGLDVMSNWADVDVLTRKTVEMSSEYKDVLVAGSTHGEAVSIRAALANSGGPDLEIDMQLVDPDGNAFFLTDDTYPAGRFFFAAAGFIVPAGYRLQARATAGEGFLAVYVQTGKSL